MPENMVNLVRREEAKLKSQGRFKSELPGGEDLPLKRVLLPIGNESHATC